MDPSPVPPAATARPRAHTNHAIQQLRGVAILLVLWMHLSLPYSLYAVLPGGLNNPGYAGVELFFVISGYVVMTTLRANGWSAGYFVARRAFRLYPTILVFLGIALAALLWANGFPEGHPGRAILGGSIDAFRAQAIEVLTGTFFGASGTLYSFGAVWSLTVEFQFYLAVAVILLGCGLARLTPPRTESLLRVLALLGLVGLVVARLAILAGAVLPQPVRLPVAWKVDFLLAGVLIALALPRRDLPNARPRWLPPLSPAMARAGVWLTIAAGLVVLSVGPAPPLTPVPVPRHDGLALPIVLLLFGGTIAFATTLAPGLVRGRAALVLGWVGDRSYGIYLLHFPCLAITWFLITAVSPATASDPLPYGALQALIGLSLSFLLAEASYRWVERPAIGFGARLIGRWRNRG